MTIEDARGGTERPGGGGTGQAGGRRPRHTTRELRRYEALFAARTRGMRSSAMRDMFALTERPDVISLAGGLPDTSSFPPELYAKLMSRIAATAAARALQYGPTEGMQAVMECIVDVMAAEQTAVDPEDLLVTTGGQQVIDLVCKTLVDPGDVIVAEAPTYPGAIPAFAAYQADVVQVEMDDHGLPVEELAATLDRLEGAGRRPKLIYTIPNFQNPTGVTMSLSRRHALVALARERELLVLEDNPYGLLRYEGDPLPTLYSLDASSTGRGGASDFVIYLGTFSKILAPGLRLGWAIAPRPVLEKLNLGKQGADLCSSPMAQLFVASFFAEGAVPGSQWREYLARVKDLYRRRRDVMLDALQDQLAGLARWTTPQGGLFVWATIEGGVDTTDLLARSERVAFVPGRGAYMDGRRGASSMRLNFAGSPEEDIREGIAQIAQLVRREGSLLGALRGSAATRKGRAAPARSAASGPRGGTHQGARHGTRPAGDDELSDVLQLPREGRRTPRRSRRG